MINVLYLAEDARLKFITKIYQILIKLSIKKKNNPLEIFLFFHIFFLMISYIDIISFISSENWRESKIIIIIINYNEPL